MFIAVVVYSTNVKKLPVSGKLLTLNLSIPILKSII